MDGTMGVWEGGNKRKGVFSHENMMANIGWWVAADSRLHQSARHHQQAYSVSISVRTDPWTWQQQASYLVCQ